MLNLMTPRCLNRRYKTRRRRRDAAVVYDMVVATFLRLFVLLHCNKRLRGHCTIDLHKCKYLNEPY